MPVQLAPLGKDAHVVTPSADKEPHAAVAAAAALRFHTLFCGSDCGPWWAAARAPDAASTPHAAAKAATATKVARTRRCGRSEVRTGNQVAASRTPVEAGDCVWTLQGSSGSSENRIARRMGIHRAAEVSTETTAGLSAAARTGENKPTLFSPEQQGAPAWRGRAVYVHPKQRHMDARPSVLQRAPVAARGSASALEFKTITCSKNRLHHLLMLSRHDCGVSRSSSSEGLDSSSTAAGRHSLCGSGSSNSIFGRNSETDMRLSSYVSCSSGSRCSSNSRSGVSSRKVNNRACSRKTRRHRSRSARRRSGSSRGVDSRSRTSFSEEASSEENGDTERSATKKRRKRRKESGAPSLGCTYEQLQAGFYEDSTAFLLPPRLPPLGSLSSPPPLIALMADAAAEVLLQQNCCSRCCCCASAALASTCSCLSADERPGHVSSAAAAGGAPTGEGRAAAAEKLVHVYASQQTDAGRTDGSVREAETRPQRRRTNSHLTRQVHQLASGLQCAATYWPTADFAREAADAATHRLHATAALPAAKSRCSHSSSRQRRRPLFKRSSAEAGDGETERAAVKSTAADCHEGPAAAAAEPDGVAAAPETSPRRQEAAGAGPLACEASAEEGEGESPCCSGDRLQHAAATAAARAAVAALQAGGFCAGCPVHGRRSGPATGNVSPLPPSAGATGPHTRTTPLKQQQERQHPVETQQLHEEEYSECQQQQNREDWKQVQQQNLHGEQNLGAAERVLYYRELIRVLSLLLAREEETQQENRLPPKMPRAAGACQARTLEEGAATAHATASAREGRNAAAGASFSDATHGEVEAAVASESVKGRRTTPAAADYALSFLPVSAPGVRPGLLLMQQQACLFAQQMRDLLQMLLRLRGAAEAAAAAGDAAQELGLTAALEVPAGSPCAAPEGRTSESLDARLETAVGGSERAAGGRRADRSRGGAEEKAANTGGHEKESSICRRAAAGATVVEDGSIAWAAEAYGAEFAGARSPAAARSLTSAATTLHCTTPQDQEATQPLLEKCLRCGTCSLERSAAAEEATGEGEPAGTGTVAAAGTDEDDGRRGKAVAGPTLAAAGAVAAAGEYPRENPAVANCTLAGAPAVGVAAAEEGGEGEGVEGPAADATHGAVAAADEQGEEWEGGEGSASAELEDGPAAAQGESSPLLASSRVDAAAFFSDSTEALEREHVYASPHVKSVGGNKDTEACVAEVEPGAATPPATAAAAILSAAGPQVLHLTEQDTLSEGAAAINAPVAARATTAAAAEGAARAPATRTEDAPAEKAAKAGRRCGGPDGSAAASTATTELEGYSSLLFRKGEVEKAIPLLLQARTTDALLQSVNEKRQQGLLAGDAALRGSSASLFLCEEQQQLLLSTLSSLRCLLLRCHAVTLDCSHSLRVAGAAATRSADAAASAPPASACSAASVAIATTAAYVDAVPAVSAAGVATACVFADPVKSVWTADAAGARRRDSGSSGSRIKRNCSSSCSRSSLSTGRPSQNSDGERNRAVGGGASKRHVADAETRLDRQREAAGGGKRGMLSSSSSFQLPGKCRSTHLLRGADGGEDTSPHRDSNRRRQRSGKAAAAGAVAGEAPLRRREAQGKKRGAGSSKAAGTPLIAATEARGAAGRTRAAAVAANNTSGATASCSDGCAGPSASSPAALRSFSTTLSAEQPKHRKKKRQRFRRKRPQKQEQQQQQDKHPHKEQQQEKLQQQRLQQRSQERQQQEKKQGHQHSGKQLPAHRLFLQTLRQIARCRAAVLALCTKSRWEAAAARKPARSCNNGSSNVRPASLLDEEKSVQRCRVHAATGVADVNESVCCCDSQAHSEEGPFEQQHDAELQPHSQKKLRQDTPQQERKAECARQQEKMQQGEDTQQRRRQQSTLRGILQRQPHNASSVQELQQQGELQRDTLQPQQHQTSRSEEGAMNLCSVTGALEAAKGKAAGRARSATGGAAPNGASSKGGSFGAAAEGRRKRSIDTLTWTCSSNSSSTQNSTSSQAARTAEDEGDAAGCCESTPTAETEVVAAAVQPEALAEEAIAGEGGQTSLAGKPAAKTLPADDRMEEERQRSIPDDKETGKEEEGERHDHAEEKRTRKQEEDPYSSASLLARQDALFDLASCCLSDALGDNSKSGDSTPQQRHQQQRQEQEQQQHEDDEQPQQQRAHLKECGVEKQQGIECHGCCAAKCSHATAVMEEIRRGRLETKGRRGKRGRSGSSADWNRVDGGSAAGTEAVSLTWESREGSSSTSCIEPADPGGSGRRKSRSSNNREDSSGGARENSGSDSRNNGETRTKGGGNDGKIKDKKSCSSSSVVDIVILRAEAARNRAEELQLQIGRYVYAAHALLPPPQLPLWYSNWVALRAHRECILQQQQGLLQRVQQQQGLLQRVQQQQGLLQRVQQQQRPRLKKQQQVRRMRYLLSEQQQHRSQQQNRKNIQHQAVKEEEGEGRQQKKGEESETQQQHERRKMKETRTLQQQRQQQERPKMQQEKLQQCVRVHSEVKEHETAEGKFQQRGDLLSIKRQQLLASFCSGSDEDASTVTAAEGGEEAAAGAGGTPAGTIGNAATTVARASAAARQRMNGRRRGKGASAEAPATAQEAMLQLLLKLREKALRSSVHGEQQQLTKQQQERRTWKRNLLQEQETRQQQRNGEEGEEEEKAEGRGQRAAETLRFAYFLQDSDTSCTSRESSSSSRRGRGSSKSGSTRRRLRGISADGSTRNRRHRSSRRNSSGSSSSSRSKWRSSSGDRTCSNSGVGNSRRRKKKKRVCRTEVKSSEGTLGGETEWSDRSSAQQCEAPAAGLASASSAGWKIAKDDEEPRARRSRAAQDKLLLQRRASEAEEACKRSLSEALRLPSQVLHGAQQQLQRPSGMLQCDAREEERREAKAADPPSSAAADFAPAAAAGQQKQQLGNQDSTEDIPTQTTRLSAPLRLSLWLRRTGAYNRLAAAAAAASPSCSPFADTTRSPSSTLASRAALSPCVAVTPGAAVISAEAAEAGCSSASLVHYGGRTARRHHCSSGRRSRSRSSPRGSSEREETGMRRISSHGEGDAEDDEEPQRDVAALRTRRSAAAGAAESSSLSAVDEAAGRANRRVAGQPAGARSKSASASSEEAECGTRGISFGTALRLLRMNHTVQLAAAGRGEAASSAAAVSFDGGKRRPEGVALPGAGARRRKFDEVMSAAADAGILADGAAGAPVSLRQQQHAGLYRGRAAAAAARDLSSTALWGEASTPATAWRRAKALLAGRRSREEGREEGRVLACLPPAADTTATAAAEEALSIREEASTLCIARRSTLPVSNGRGWPAVLRTSTLRSCSISAAAAAAPNSVVLARPLYGVANPRLRWSREETAVFVQAVNRVGVGNWRLIADHYSAELGNRTNLQLKDKWVNLLNHQHVVFNRATNAWCLLPN